MIQRPILYVRQRPICTADQTSYDDSFFIININKLGKDLSEGLSSPRIRVIKRYAFVPGDLFLHRDENAF